MFCPSVNFLLIVVSLGFINSWVTFPDDLWRIIKLNFFVYSASSLSSSRDSSSSNLVHLHMRVFFLHKLVFFFEFKEKTVCNRPAFVLRTRLLFLSVKSTLYVCSCQERSNGQITKTLRNCFAITSWISCNYTEF